MSTIDPRLRYLISSATTPETGTAEHLGLAADEAVAVTPTAEVLVRLRLENETTEEALALINATGMNVRYVVTGPYIVVSGSIPLDRLSDIERIGSVRRIESSRLLTPELDRCVSEVKADRLHSSDPAVKGAGTIIGIIDTGIDFRHPDFLNEDGTTRILHFWNQNAPPSPEGSVPYGREYNRTQINAALEGAAAPSDIPQIDSNGHGTHVCGIAAGGGRALSTHLGLAPEAELIIVSLSTVDAPTLGRSVRAFEAFAYVVERANGTPVAINFSQGMNGGGHSGETVLETGLDNLARRPGVAIVKSAGNEQQMRIHAGGVLTANETQKVQLDVRTNNRINDIIEIWFDDEDDIAIAVVLPGGTSTPFVRRGDEAVFTTEAGNSVSIDLDDDAEGTGDTVATIIVSRGTSSMIQPGMWQLLLQAGAITNGRFDAWIERAERSGAGGEQTRFSEDSNDPTRTITIPGTARNVITVGSYVTRLFSPPDAPLGAISLFSSRGPARYGNLKPDLLAPGEVTEAARAGSQGVTGIRGTSMAAPVVTGAAGLILSQRPELNCPQLKQILVRSANRSGSAAEAPDSGWGHGKLDVEAALELARQVQFPLVSNVHVEGDTISWETDIETTGAIRFLPTRRQLLLGKNTRSISDLTLARSHRIKLTGVPVGDYFCQIVAFSSDNYSTEEDNGGRCYKVQVIGTNVTPEHVVAPANEVAATDLEVTAAI
jgi:subtilisin family serine protease